MKLKTILYFHHSIGIGGSPRSLSFLISGLDRNEFEPIVVIPKRSGNDAVKRIFRKSDASILEEANIRPFNGSTVAPCGGLKQRAYAVLSYNRLVSSAARIVDKVKPDLVHINSTCIVGAAKGAHLINPNLPVVAHVREPLLQNWWGRMLARMNRRHVDWFVAIDKYGLDSLGLQGRRGDVIYNFVNREQFKPDAENAALKRRSLGWSEDQVVFLSISRVSSSNGAAELATFVRETDSQLHPAALFVIAGFQSKPNRYASVALEIANSTSRCLALPFVDDVIPLINAADVIVAPFITPHSARSVFEGAAMGKPALVTDLPNLRELIVKNQTGFIFDWNKREQFIEAVNLLCDATIRARMSRSSFDHASKMFDSKINIKKTIRLYDQLILAR